MINKKYLTEYLKFKPLFFSLIRPQELQLFFSELSSVKKIESKKVLDIGCGDGFFFSVLSKSLKNKLNAVGIDIFKRDLNFANKLNVYTNTRLFDGLKFPFQDKSFDILMSNCVLEHISDIEIHLAEANRTLQQGGKYYLSLATKLWPEFLFGNKIIGKKYMQIMNKKQVHRNLFSVQRWEELFENNNFRIIKKTTYIDKKLVQWIDIAHYLSLPWLLNYKITRRNYSQYMFLKLSGIMKLIEKLINFKPRSDQPACVFYVLEKK